MKIPNYNIYHATHPDETEHGGTAVIIRQNLKHHLRAEYKQYNIQATSISLEDDKGEVQSLRSTVLQSVTISTKIMIDSLRHSETASLPEETLTPNTPSGDQGS